MSDWAGIKKAINSDLSKPLDTLITESKSDLSDLINNHYETFPNVSSKSLSSNSTITVTGKGRITFVAYSSTDGWSLIISKIDDKSVNFYVPLYNDSTKLVVFSIDFDKNISFNREGSSMTVSYIVKLK